MGKLINWHDSLKSVDVLTDPSAAEIIATQLQEFSSARGGPTVLDLSAAVIDIRLQTSIQGASILQVDLIDPWWQLLDTGPPHHYHFIDTDDAGLLIPFEVHYPLDSDCYWWLAACDVLLSSEQANVKLTFEDRIVAQLRDASGPMHNADNEHMASFIRRVVGKVPGIRFYSPSWQQEQASLQALGVDPSTIASLNPANHITQPPTSSTAPGASPQRRNPGKKPGVSPPSRPAVSSVPGVGPAVGAVGAVGGVPAVGSIPGVSNVVSLLTPPAGSYPIPGTRGTPGGRA